MDNNIVPGIDIHGFEPRKQIQRHTHRYLVFQHKTDNTVVEVICGINDTRQRSATIKHYTHVSGSHKAAYDLVSECTYISKE